MRLLVLDDDPAIGRLVGRIADGCGFTAEITTEAADFHRAYAANVPDAIVLDLQLGNTDGVEQIRFLSGQGFPNALILVSGFDSRVLATAATLAGNQGLDVAAILNKPIDVPRLRLVLSRLRGDSSAPSHQRLELALEQDEIFLEYQPIVHSGSRKVHRIEALARWQHPELGRLEPSRFMSLISESSSLAGAFTDRVITLAARSYRRLTSYGILMPVSVNVSSQCLLDLGFPDRVEQLLRQEDMPRDRLYLEITENAVFDDTLQVMDILSRIRLKGIQLTIDDFGTGHSSLRLLRQMPFTALKIDRSFIADLANSPDARAIVKSLIDLAAALNLECIAEGVENAATASILDTLNVGFIQGFLIGAPMGLEELVSWPGLRRTPGATVVPLIPPQRAATAMPLPRAVPSPAVAAMPAPVAAVPVQARPVAATPSAPPTPANPPPELSPRQQTVMQLLAEGLSVKEIARRLDLSIGTVKTHLAQAYMILGAHNRIEALRRAGLPLQANTARGP